MPGPRAWIAAVFASTMATATARADLDGYVKAADPSYAWEVVGSEDLKDGKATYLKLTSQTWRGMPWVHSLNIYEPREVKHPDAMLLMIAGGNNDDGPPGSG